MKPQTKQQKLALIANDTIELIKSEGLDVQETLEYLNREMGKGKK